MATGLPKKIALALGTAAMAIVGWAWFTVKRVLEIIGISTVTDDAKSAEGVVANLIIWLFQQPWWVSASFATIWTVIFGYLVIRNVTYGQEGTDLAKNLQATNSFLQYAKMAASARLTLIDLGRFSSEFDRARQQIARFDADPNKDIMALSNAGCVVATLPRLAALLDDHRDITGGALALLPEGDDALRNAWATRDYNLVRAQILALIEFVSPELDRAKEHCEQACRDYRSKLAEFGLMP
jgi:hypothetical protein